MSKFLHTIADDHAKGIAIPWVFSKNSHAKNTDLTLYHTIPTFNTSGKERF